MPKILIVDDESESRDLLTRGLRRQGFTVASAGDGEEACALLDGSFQMVATDLIMPRLDGIGLIKRIPVLNPDALIIVITGCADKERILALLELGVRHIIEKPFSAARLGAEIHRLMEERGKRLEFAQVYEQRIALFALTNRERELLVHLFKGKANKEISRLMAVGEQSIKNKLYRLYKKLGVCSRNQLFQLIFPM